MIEEVVGMFVRFIFTPLNSTQCVGRCFTPRQMVEVEFVVKFTRGIDEEIGFKGLARDRARKVEGKGTRHPEDAREGLRRGEGLRLNQGVQPQVYQRKR